MRTIPRGRKEKRSLSPSEFIILKALENYKNLVSKKNYKQVDEANSLPHEEWLTFSELNEVCGELGYKSQKNNLSKYLKQLKPLIERKTQRIWDKKLKRRVSPTSLYRLKQDEETLRILLQLFIERGDYSFFISDYIEDNMSTMNRLFFSFATDILNHESNETGDLTTRFNAEQLKLVLATNPLFLEWLKDRNKAKGAIKDMNATLLSAGMNELDRAWLITTFLNMSTFFNTYGKENAENAHTLAALGLREEANTHLFLLHSESEILWKQADHLIDFLRENYPRALDQWTRQEAVEKAKSMEEVGKLLKARLSNSKNTQEVNRKNRG